MTETWDVFRERFGEAASVESTYDETTVTVPPDLWISALEQARDLGLRFFDWLTAVDEEEAGFTVVAHVAAVEATADTRKADRLLLRTKLSRDSATLPTATGVFRGANWHERETHEMFGIEFAGHPNLIPLLLPDGFDGHPLRKDFVLAARVAKEWPGVKEPGEGGSGHGPARPAAATRRRMVPPGVPDGWLKPLPEAEVEVEAEAEAQVEVQAKAEVEAEVAEVTAAPEAATEPAAPPTEAAAAADAVGEVEAAAEAVPAPEPPADEPSADEAPGQNPPTPEGDDA
jgi:NADH-quinone oxidoreductase subunit C